MSRAPVVAQANALGGHVGATDPAQEGFALWARGPTTNAVGAVQNDSGVDSWFTMAGAGAVTWYAQTLDMYELARLDWELAAHLRVVQSQPGYPNSFLELGMGTSRYLLRFGLGSDGDTVVAVGSSSLSPVIELQGGPSAYHIYQVRYSSAASTAELWVDGVKRMEGITAESYWQRSLRWGEGQAGPSQANWHLVSLQIIPEPWPLALLVLGAAWLAAARWGRQRRCNL